MGKGFLRLALGLVVLLGFSFSTLLWACLSCGKKKRVFRKPSAYGKVAYLRVHFFETLFGGTLAHTQGVIEGFEENDHQVVLLSSDRLSGLSIRPRLYQIPPYRSLEPLGEIREMAYNLKLFVEGLAILRREKPRFLYYRHTGFCLAPLILSRCLTIPLVLEFNSSDDWRARFWKERRYRFWALLKWAERLNLSRSDLVVTVSDICRDQIVKISGIPKERILVNPNGVNPSRFNPSISGAPVRKRLGMTPEGIVVGFAGTFMKYHGVEILAQAILNLKRQGRLVGFYFLLLGEGGCQEEIQGRLLASGCGPWVRFPGAIPFSEVQDYLAACDILVSPHHPPPADVGFFGSPIKIFEYMAMGKAIVASRVGQIAELLSDGREALLIPAGDVQALEEAILKLACDSHLRARLGASAREKAGSSHTWKQNFKGILNARRGVG